MMGGGRGTAAKGEEDGKRLGEVHGNVRYFNPISLVLSHYSTLPHVSNLKKNTNLNTKI